MNKLVTLLVAMSVTVGALSPAVASNKQEPRRLHYDMLEEAWHQDKWREHHNKSKEWMDGWIRPAENTYGNRKAFIDKLSDYGVWLDSWGGRSARYAGNETKKAYKRLKEVCKESAGQHGAHEDFDCMARNLDDYSDGFFKLPTRAYYYQWKVVNRTYGLP